MPSFIERRLIRDWAYIRRLWSVRLTALFGVVYALSGVWTVLAGTIPNWVYISVGFSMNLILFVARVTKQKGMDE